MSIKIARYALIWFGSLTLLSNLHIIRPLDASIVWPVILIIAGLSLKHYNHSMTCALGGKCTPCGKGKKRKCPEGNCGDCEDCK